MMNVASEGDPTGHITYEQFIQASDLFIKLSNENNDTWKVEGNEDVIGERYLTASYTRRLANNNGMTDSNNFSLFNCRYDVVYSLSHSMPVLYFLISRPCGTVLDLQDVWSLYSVDFNNESNKSMWDVVSMKDHPVIHTPFFCVHPCNNWQLLKECYDGRKQPVTGIQFLITWLSLIGNTFGLRLSNNYLKIN